MNADERGLLHAEISGSVVKAFDDVYNELGFGFLESVYEKAMTLALRAIGLRTEQQASLKVMFRGLVVGEFRADLVVEGTVVVELKAARAIEPIHEAQLLNYLRASGIGVGLLLNFGPKPAFRRMVFTSHAERIRVQPR